MAAPGHTVATTERVETVTQRLQITAPLVKETYGHAGAQITKHVRLCGAVHNKSCFIKAKSHPLSVCNRRRRLNRRGNPIPFCSGVILIHELVYATLVCGYEPGKHPRQRHITPADRRTRRH